MEAQNSKNIWVWVLIAVALIFFFGNFGMHGYGNGYGYGMMGFGMGFGFIFMLLFWGAIIWLVMSIINSLAGTKDEKALILLKRRYAAGEISKRQYEEIKKELAKG